LDLHDKKYVIGIDLGTTNCSVSYVDLQKSEKKNRIQTFNIPQLTGHGEFTRVNSLPSFLYIPGEYDISKESLKHPWKKDHDQFPGVFARDHGAKIPSRLVSSAKSWLCNAQVDREGKILPWGSDGIEKISPVTATVEYLKHIKNSWNHYVKDEDLFFENQYLVITVPASFDESARALTLKAATQTGLAEVTLLEEPLAAFYSWLIKHEQNWQSFVNPNELVLVCDVGGGTTDFTLITLKESEGSPRFERLAVGDHLMLGGDNIDRSAAELVASKFKTGQGLDKDKWKSLCFKCRQAKEQIFEEKEDSVRITLKGEGRSLISGTLAADLTRDDLTSLLNRDFFTDINHEQDLKNLPGKNEEKIVSEFGILSEKEESISRHIIMFLEKQRANIKASLGKEPMPDHILFNGGSLKPAFIQDKIRRSIREWFNCKDESLPKVLENNDLDLAVGLGASYYGLVKQGIGVKVGSGSPRSYYIGVADDTANGQKAVCVVERGLDEGSDIELAGMEFEVLANQPVSFDVFSSSFRSGDCSGDMVEIDDTLTAMPPFKTIINFGQSTQGKTIPVKIKAAYTEMGSLSMCCDSVVSDHKWDLQFQLRDSSANAVSVADGEIFSQEIVENTCLLIDDFFLRASFDSDGNNNIVKSIEKLVEKKKTKWPLGFLRAMADRLIRNEKAIKISPEHEVRWLNMAGFCMRPGFGDAFDGQRIKKLWRVYLSGLNHSKQKQNRIEWWIFLRRISSGFNAGQQRQFFQNISQYVLKDNGSKIKISPQESVELWMAIANLERLLVKDKVVLAKALLNKFKPGKTPRQLLWALSRIGAREPLYGSMDRVVPPKEVSNWVRRIIKFNWKENDPVLEMIVQMVRKTNDRTRDMDPESLEMILGWLAKRGVKNEMVNMVKTRTDMAIKEQSRVFGESLPAGLVLKNSS
jgi:molecular chaperone DnaK (HSP70)